MIKSCINRSKGSAMAAQALQFPRDYMSIFVDLVALSWGPFLAEKRSENG